MSAAAGERCCSSVLAFGGGCGGGGSAAPFVTPALRFPARGGAEEVSAAVLGRSCVSTGLKLEIIRRKNRKY